MKKLFFCLISTILISSCNSKQNNELFEIYSKFLKNAELRFQTGESGNIEVISAKGKSKEIETQKAQLEYDLVVYQKQLQYNLCLLQCATKNSNSLLKVFGNTYEQEMDSIVFIICSHVFNGDKCAGRRTNTG